MISLNYLKYLFSSKKYLLIFLGVICVLNITIDHSESLIFIMCITCLLSYIVPLDTFKYIHDKKAVDSYYCLPISRKQLLYTGLLFSSIVVCSYFFISYSIVEVLNCTFVIKTLLYILVVFLGLITLIVFNVLLYQIGNSILDGVVMIGAYSVLPLVVYCVLGIFFESYVYGFQSVTWDFETYFSPLYMVIANFMNIVTPASDINYRYVIAEGVILIVSLLLLQRSFINRKVERAGSPSKEVFAYPLVMNLYAFMLIMCVACNYNYSFGSLISFISDHAILLIIIFALYVCAHFVYKRSFYFDIKIPVIFVGLLIVCFGFACFTKANDGYGIANKYNTDNINYYELYTFDIKGDLKKDIEELCGSKSEYVSLSICVNENGEATLDKEVIDYFEKVRTQALEDYYGGKECQSGQLYAKNNYQFNGSYFYFSDEYSYRFDEELELNDILKLAKYDYVKINLDLDKAYYDVNSDGSISEHLYDEPITTSF